MTNLSDLDGILLSSAAQRDTGSVFPVPDNVSGAPFRVAKAIASLLKRGLIEERETTDKPAAHRVDGDVAYGVYLTDAGKTAIGIVDDVAADDETPPAPPAAVTPRVTKASTVLALLQRDEGATLAELIAATGWLPHTTRAALTGLRKKGHTLEKTKRGDQTCYRVTAAAA